MTKIYYLNRLFPNNSFHSDDERMIEKIVEAIHSDENLDIRNIAKINYTSPSSISRLAKRAGFNNFKELIFFFPISFLPLQSIKSKNFRLSQLIMSGKKLIVTSMKLFLRERSICLARDFASFSLIILTENYY